MPRFQAQERSYYCGPACLRILQSELGCAEPLSQDHWARIMGTTTEGTSCAGIKRGLRQLEKEFRVRTRIPEGYDHWIDTPQLVIVHEGKRNHWLVAKICSSKDLVSIRGPLAVYLLDPDSGDKRSWAGEGPEIRVWTWDKFRNKFLRTKREGYGLFLSMSIHETGKAEELRRSA